jgi:hypothetical protein
MLPMLTGVDVVTVPPFWLIVGAAGALAANAMPAGMQDKTSMTATRITRILPLSFFISFSSPFLPIIKT